MTILVIEDDREAADYLQKAFAEAGHTAHIARDGETGFTLAEFGTYDAIVVDRMLPHRDGLSVIAGLRSGETDGSPDGWAPDELAAHRFTDELVRTHRVSDATYAAAEEAFGREGVLDMVHLTGMYLATSALLNAFEVPAPEIPAPPIPD